MQARLSFIDEREKFKFRLNVSASLGGWLSSERARERLISLGAGEPVERLQEGRAT